MVLYLTCNTGALTSTPFALEHPWRPLALEVPSLSVATAVRVEFTSTSGTAPFWPVQRADGTGALHTVTSGPGQAFALLPRAPTRWGRVAFANSQTEVHTLALFTLHG